MDGMREEKEPLVLEHLGYTPVSPLSEGARLVGKARGNESLSSRAKFKNAKKEM